MPSIRYICARLNKLLSADVIHMLYLWLILTSICDINMRPKPMIYKIETEKYYVSLLLGHPVYIYEHTWRKGKFQKKQEKSKWWIDIIVKKQLM